MPRLAAVPVLVVLMLGACATSSPPRLYQLRATTVAAPVAPRGGPWLVGPVTVPEYVDRAALVRREGRSGLRVMEGHRWAEPLADAVPRVLRQALSARLGVDQVWSAPVPAGVRPARQLRVEVLRLDADEANLVLLARWSLTSAGGTEAIPPLVGQDEVRIAVGPADPDALAAAHGAALDRLAEAIVRAAR